METVLQRALSNKLCLIYALNIADYICTVTLLRTGDFAEANPLMRPVIGDPLSGLFFKCLLPAALLLLVRRMCRVLSVRELVYVDRFICFVLALYCALCAIHIISFVLW